MIGATDRGELSIDPYGPPMLVCGTSGSGKSTVTTALLERLSGSGYQFALVDPEGRVLRSNPALAGFLGYSEAELGTIAEETPPAGEPPA